MEKHDKVVVFGLGSFAQVARVYLDCDSPYEVVAFTVDRAFMQGRECRRVAGSAVRGRGKKVPARPV